MSQKQKRLAKTILKEGLINKIEKREKNGIFLTETDGKTRGFMENVYE